MSGDMLTFWIIKPGNIFTWFSGFGFLFRKKTKYQISKDFIFAKKKVHYFHFCNLPILKNEKKGPFC